MKKGRGIAPPAHVRGLVELLTDLDLAGDDILLNLLEFSLQFSGCALHGGQGNTIDAAAVAARAVLPGTAGRRGQRNGPGGEQGQGGASRRPGPGRGVGQDLWLNRPSPGYETYFRGIYRKVDRLWKFPKALEVLFEQGDVLVEFTIVADGNVSEVQLRKSSGFPEFDENVLAAIRKAAPFGPIPRGLGRSLRVLAPFEFSNPMVR
jgi:TonB family protein